MQCTKKSYKHSKYNYVSCKKLFENFTDSTPTTSGSFDTPLISSSDNNTQGNIIRIGSSFDQPTNINNKTENGISCSCTGDSSSNNNFTLSCNCTRQQKEGFADLIPNPEVQEMAKIVSAELSNPVVQEMAKLVSAELSNPVLQEMDKIVSIEVPNPAIQEIPKIVSVELSNPTVREIAKIVSAELSNPTVQEMPNINVPIIDMITGISNAMKQPDQTCDKTPLYMTVGILATILIILIIYVIYQQMKKN